MIDLPLFQLARRLNSQNSLVHNSWSEIVRCEIRAGYLLKKKKKTSAET